MAPRKIATSKPKAATRTTKGENVISKKKVTGAKTQSAANSPKSRSNSKKVAEAETEAPPMPKTKKKQTAQLEPETNLTEETSGNSMTTNAMPKASKGRPRKGTKAKNSQQPADSDQSSPKKGKPVKEEKIEEPPMIDATKGRIA